MTLTADPILSSPPPTRLSRPRAWLPTRATLARLHLFQNAALLTLLATLAWDRYLVCKEFLFKYTDEDQALMWLAAHELLNGKLHEPCFYGQDYNSCLEGHLAAPFIAMGAPYHVAVPLVTVVLGLLPFLAIALAAWRRGHPLVAAAALLLPILLPVRYAMMTGMPRGFMTGLAVATIPLILLLPAPRRATQALAIEPTVVERARRRRPLLTRSWPALRYFFAAAFAVVAIQLNPNCLVVLVPAALFALLTSWREWKFWLFGAAGLLAAAPYPLFVQQFYYRYHTDYPVYLRGKVFTWSFDNFRNFLWNDVAPPNAPSPILLDLVPIHISAAHAPLFMVAAFTAVGLLLLARVRVAALLSLLAGVAFVFATFAYDRVNDGRGGNAISFPFGRMYLALPVLFAWLLLLVPHKPAAIPFRLPAALPRWATRGALAGMIVTAVTAFHEKSAELPALAEREFRASTVCILVPVDFVYATAREVQRAATTHDADLLVIANMGQKVFAYAVPCLTTVDTLLPPMERRTWRVVEEELPGRHENILLLSTGTGTPVAGGQPLNTRSETAPPPPAPPAPASPAPAGRGNRGGRAAQPPRPAQPPPAARPNAGRGRAARNFDAVPPITLVPVRRGPDGKPLSANDTLRALGINVPRVFTPTPTPDNPDPTPTVQRNNWGR